MTDRAVPAVHADGLSKSFTMPHEQTHTLKERALHPLRRSTSDRLDALRDVSFEVRHGEFFGIVGRNGSGKSTLLKCLAGIYRPDAGRLFMNGRLSTFIELGVGFNPDLAALDNVMLNGTILGLSPREARRRFDRVIDFAELRDFTELKLKNYSSGMLVRLAFAVMIQVDADILIIDEVLAVGDAAFQQKCFDEFGRIRRSGTTVLLVTHDMGAVQRFCDRAMLLERGTLVETGDPEHVADRYLELSFSASARAAATGGGEVVDDDLRLTDGTAEIVDAWFEDEHGTPSDVVHIHRPCAFRCRVRFHERLTDPLFGVSLFNSQDDFVWAANNRRFGPSGTFEQGDETVFSVRFDNEFAPDRYWATPAVAPSAGDWRWHDRRHRMASVVVSGNRLADGLVDLPFGFDLAERAAPTETA